MQPYICGGFQERAHLLRFVGRQVVRADVDLLPRPSSLDLAEEAHELLAGMSFCSLAQHFTRLNV